MTEHLPECPAPLCNDQCAGWECPHWCFCEALRACEERVIDAAVQRVEAFEYISTIGVTLSSVAPKAAVIAAIKGDQP